MSGTGTQSDKSPKKRKVRSILPPQELVDETGKWRILNCHQCGRPMSWEPGDPEPSKCPVCLIKERSGNQPVVIVGGMVASKKDSLDWTAPNPASIESTS